MELKARLRSLEVIVAGLDRQGAAHGRRMDTVAALACFNRANPHRNEIAVLKEAIAVIEEFGTFDTSVTR